MRMVVYIPIRWTLCLGAVVAALIGPCSVTAQPATPAAMVYVYPPQESGDDQRMNYYWELLQSALDATAPKWGPYVLAASDVVMNADRAQALLSHSQTITLMVRTTSMERESLVRPVLLPLDKGLIGYRLFLIQKPTQAKLAHVHSLEDLKAFSIGQSSRWVDTQILRSAGLTVEQGTTYASLFKMLEVGRFDLFSRGVNEIGNEFRVGRKTNRDLRIDRYLLLYYPLPRYYFFAPTPEGERLAKRVEEGLHMLIDNGQFDRQYKAYKRSVLADLQLSGRHVLRIANPTLSPQTPLGNPEYWDNLSDELKATR